MHIDLVDHREIARRAGVSVNHVSAWTREPGFPEPVSSLSIGDVWVWGPVWGWLHHAGYPTDVDTVVLADHHPLKRDTTGLTFTQLDLGPTPPESRPY